jgi:predicted Zn-dependent protease
VLTGLASGVGQIYKSFAGWDNTGLVTQSVIDAAAGSTIGTTGATSIETRFGNDPSAYIELFFSGSTEVGYAAYINGAFVLGSSNAYAQAGGFSNGNASGNGTDSAIPGNGGSFINLDGFGSGDEFTSAGAVSANVSGIAQYVVANGDTNASQAAEIAELDAYAQETYSSSGATNPASYAYEGAKWATKTITWSFANSAGTAASPFSSYVTSTQYQNLVKQAFAAWGAAGGLTLTQVSDSTSADIRVGFGDFSTATSGIAGYTAYQQNSSLQIQPDAILRLEDPTQNALVAGAGGALEYSGTNTYLYNDILHEVGHALGLASDADSSSVMYYYADGNTGVLDANDTSGIQALYSSTQNAMVKAPTGTPSAATIASMHQQMIQATASFLGESAATLTAAPPPPQQVNTAILAPSVLH